MLSILATIAKARRIISGANGKSWARSWKPYVNSNTLAEKMLAFVNSLDGASTLELMIRPDLT